MQFYRDAYVEKLTKQGMDPQEAEQLAQDNYINFSRRGKLEFIHISPFAFEDIMQDIKGLTQEAHIDLSQLRPEAELKRDRWTPLYALKGDYGNNKLACKWLERQKITDLETKGMFAKEIHYLVRELYIQQLPIFYLEEGKLALKSRTWLSPKAVRDLEGLKQDAAEQHMPWTSYIRAQKVARGESNHR